jgi:hypothetical protein
MNANRVAYIPKPQGWRPETNPMRAALGGLGDDPLNLPGSASLTLDPGSDPMSVSSSLPLFAEPNLFSLGPVPGTAPDVSDTSSRTPTANALNLPAESSLVADPRNAAIRASLLPGGSAGYTGPIFANTSGWIRENFPLLILAFIGVVILPKIID